ncbi:MAG: isochorismatase family protein, partial [Hyphomicrobiales bacterium]|nr:isochorismatase family protein [Hyphomicrobiales bacterium]
GSQGEETMLIGRARSHLLVIDMQEKLAPHVAGIDRVMENCRRLAVAAARLGVPVTISEHCPSAIGRTIGALRSAAGTDARAIEKVEFSCCRNAALKQRMAELKRAGRDEIVVAGIEAHVCVCQTVLDLIAEGFEVFVAADAIGSRLQETRDLAIGRMRRAGAAIVAQEMVIFEWLERADTAEFKELLAVIK